MAKLYQLEQAEQAVRDLEALKQSLDRVFHEEAKGEAWRFTGVLMTLVTHQIETAKTAVYAIQEAQYSYELENRRKILSWQEVDKDAFASYTDFRRYSVNTEDEERYADYWNAWVKEEGQTAWTHLGVCKDKETAQELCESYEAKRR
jgi:hypothetical protein